MAKIGVEISIDVMKIDKTRLYQGKKGKYLTMTTFIDLDNKDEYGNNGFVSEKQTKEESEQKIRTTILGNYKLFWRDENQQPQQQGNQPQQDHAPEDDMLPF